MSDMSASGRRIASLRIELRDTSGSFDHTDMTMNPSASGHIESHGGLPGVTLKYRTDPGSTPFRGWCAHHPTEPGPCARPPTELSPGVHDASSACMFSRADKKPVPTTPTPHPTAQPHKYKKIQMLAIRPSVPLFLSVSPTSHLLLLCLSPAPPCPSLHAFSSCMLTVLPLPFLRLTRPCASTPA